MQAAHNAQAAFTIAHASVGDATLLVDSATPLVRVPMPLVIRIAIGLPQQEDLPVVSFSTLHFSNGTVAAPMSADGRYSLRLGAPTRFAHAAGEPLRVIDRQAILQTRFQIFTERPGGSPSGSSAVAPVVRLFDGYLMGPDAPHLHDEDAPLDLQLSDLSADGMKALGRHDPTVRKGRPSYRHHAYGPLSAHDAPLLQSAWQSAAPLMLTVSAAVRGWASFAFEPSAFTAANVAIRLRPVHANVGSANRRLSLSRGGTSLHRPALPLLPLVGAVDLATGRGYWTNATEGGLGWVASLRLADFPQLVRGGARQSGFGSVGGGGGGSMARVDAAGDGGVGRPELSAGELSLAVPPLLA